MLIPSIQKQTCGTAAENMMCDEERHATDESGLVFLGVHEASIWGFKTWEEWNEGGGRKGESQRGLITSVYRWN